MRSKKFLGGLALGAAIASGVAIFFNPTSGKKNREKFKQVSKKVSEELVHHVGKAKKITKKEYDAIVEKIIKKYSKDDLMKKEAWMEIADELKMRWKDIQKEMKKAPAKKKK